jgi:thioredoxin reductase (NADPH)
MFRVRDTSHEAGTGHLPMKHARRMATSLPEIGDRSEDLATTAASRLTEEQLTRALHYATSQEVAAGQVLFDIGDDSGDLVLCGTAHLEAMCPSDAPDREDVFFTYGPGQFAGELGLLTGQWRGLTIRVWPSGAGCPPCSSALSGAS